MKVSIARFVTEEGRADTIGALNTWYGITEIYHDSLGLMVLRTKFGADRTLYDFKKGDLLLVEND
jgi:hypothetical protein